MRVGEGVRARPTPASLRRRRAGAALVGFALAAGAAGGLAFSPLLAVNRVQVVGVPAALRSQVVAAAGLSGHPPMVSVSPGNVARKVERLPWAERASVSRSWPDRVVVRLGQRVPLALVAAGGRFEEVDATGRAIAWASSRPAGLALITSAQAVPLGSRLGAPGAALCSDLGRLPLWLRSTLLSAMMSRGRLYLAVRGGPVVAMGRPVQLAQKAQSLLAMMRNAALPPNSRLNLSVPSEPVLTAG